MLSILYCISNVFYQLSILFVQSIMCRVCSWRQFSVFPDRLSESILIMQKTPIHLFSAFFFNQVHKIDALFYGWISRQWPLKLQARTALGGQPEILQEFCHHTASTAGVFILLPFDQTWQHRSNEIKKMPISFTLFLLYPSFQFFAVFYVR